MGTDLVLASSYRITDQIVEDLGHSIYEFQCAVERSKFKKLTILAAATSVRYVIRDKKRLALGSMAAGMTTILVSAVRDVKKVNERKDEVLRVLQGVCTESNEAMLMLQLALIDFDLLLTRGYTRPDFNGKFTVVNGNTISLCVSPELKGVV